MCKEIHISLLDRAQDERIDEIIAKGEFCLFGLDFGPLELINEENGSITIRVKKDQETLCEFCQEKGVVCLQPLGSTQKCAGDNGNDDSC